MDCDDEIEELPLFTTTVVGHDFTDTPPQMRLSTSGSHRKSSLRKQKTSLTPSGATSIDVKTWMKRTFPLTYNKDQVDVSVEDLLACKYSMCSLQLTFI